MNLLSVNLLSESFKSLEKFESALNFDESPKDTFDPICFVGLNGSGKSHLVELIAECFMLAEYFFRNKKMPSFDQSNPLLFEIEYSLDASESFTLYVKLKRDIKSRIKVYVRRSSEDEYVEDSSFNFNLFPKRIIGYSSGLNETLSSPFLQIQNDFSGELSKAANNESKYSDIIDNVRMLYLDHSTNLLLVLTNLIYNHSNSVIREHTNLKRLLNFKIIINKEIRVLVKLNSQLEGIIEDLSKCSINNPSFDKTNVIELEFINDDNLRKAVGVIFGKPELFFEAISLLNNLNVLALKPNYVKWMLDRRRSGKMAKSPDIQDDEKFFRISDLLFETEDGVKIEYEGLSDGEHQLLQTLGCLNLIEEPDTLFLFDEPDTHYNPEWRSKLLSEYSQISKERNQEVLITTHSPFLVSSVRSRMVFHFEKGRKPLIDHPLFETYGSPINTINNRLFGGIGTVPSLPIEDMKKLAKKEIDEILSSIDKYGESHQKAALYKKINELEK
jgi:restriction system-associated AAA family ATPase